MYKSTPKPSSSSPSAFPIGQRRPLVLYVEDDDDNWEIAELRLSDTYDLLRAKSDQEACNLLRAHHHDIDLVVMDIALRGSVLNGVELTALVRGCQLPAHVQIPDYARHLPLLSKPVIYVTANGARYTSVQLMLSGADKVISKPVRFAELQTVLSELLSTRRSG
jgi:CheY-like chemotaxis protein